MPEPVRALPAPEPEQAELEEIDMMDAEIVELAEPTTAARTLDADLDGEEPVPESAPRPAHALRDEAEHEAPIKTPPPESGRQIMAPVAPAAPAVAYREDEAEEADLGGGADVDDLLQPDLSGGPISKAPPGVPTMEQLGETVELEGADAPGARLELAALPEADEKPDALDELELSLPRQEFSGGYHADLAPPSDVQADLARHQTSLEPVAQAAPESLTSPGFAASVPPSMHAASAAPLIVERPAVVAEPSDVVLAKPSKLPETFLEFLDASLGLKPGP